MKTSNRDLLVLVKDEFMNEYQMEIELEQLNNILFRLETLNSFCIAHEIFDVTRHKVVASQKKIAQLVRQPELKPFQFIFNKN